MVIFQVKVVRQLRKLYDIFTLSFYGSSLWQLFGNEVEKIHHAYNIAIKMAYGYHPHTLLCSRFVKFHLTNTTCNKPTIRMLARLYENDLRTVYGNNLRSISTLCGTDIGELSPRMVKENVKYRIIPPNEEWRLPILEELTFARDNNLEIDGLSRNDINEIIRYTCTI